MHCCSPSAGKGAPLAGVQASWVQAQLPSRPVWARFSYPLPRKTSPLPGQAASEMGEALCQRSLLSLDWKVLQSLPLPDPQATSVVNPFLLLSYPFTRTRHCRTFTDILIHSLPCLLVPESPLVPFPLASES